LTNWRPKISFEKTMLDLLNYWREKVKKRDYMDR
jgi:GDPmannose 4,6-dehydratase